MKDDELYDAGMAVRRKILGDAHVDRAAARTSPLTREFQDLIVRYGWGAIWTRPGLGHRERRLLVIGTMMAIGGMSLRVANWYPGRFDYSPDELADRYAELILRMVGAGS